MRLVRHLLSAKLLAITLGLGSLNTSAEVYKVVDQDGNITYTDQPAATATLQKLPPLNPMPGSIPPLGDSELVGPTEDESPLFSGYSNAVIVSPENDSVIPHHQVSIIIQLALSPQLQAGHWVQYWFDGAAQGQPVAAMAYQLDNIERGTHILSASIFDDQGKLVISTPAIRVHVKRSFSRH